MRSAAEISQLLNDLDTTIADNLEDQDLDFKEWDGKSIQKAVKTVIEMAICMANGGGGTVVFGVSDKILGRAHAILGVPLEVDQNILLRQIYDSTDPKSTPVFEELMVPEGTGRILVMQINRGLPPYTDTSGQGKIRIGTDCKPLTGTLRRKISIETGESDYTFERIPGAIESHISSAAMEAVRKAAVKEQAPADLISLTDLDLLKTLGLIKNNQLTRAGLLLVGKETSIHEYFPHYHWIHLRMTDDTQYTDRMDGAESLIVALDRITDRIMADNPLTTVSYGMFHYEYRRYPEIVLREVLMNALCHADFQINSPILIKQFPDHLEIGNPGGFIGGITPQNILHHVPVARNPLLVEALTKLRLVNRSNLGMSRMFRGMLIEGKEPPGIDEQGESVKVLLKGGEISSSFKAFVDREVSSGRGLTVDHLLILKYLLSTREIDTKTAAQLIQRTENEARDILHAMEHERSYLEHGGSGRSYYWSLVPSLHRELDLSGHPYGDRRIEWDAAKTRILSVLQQKQGRADMYLKNAEIRQITHLNRHQVTRLMNELMQENPSIKKDGKYRAAQYFFSDTPA
ncbi:MAG: ATP-binding protein [Methanoregula sp.]|nr:ATP-binding protein [Methanoregula sp.]